MASRSAHLFGPDMGCLLYSAYSPSLSAVYMAGFSSEERAADV